MATETKAGLHGSDDYINDDASGYQSPKEFSKQGDTRVIRDLMFSYTVSTTDAAGNEILSARDVTRDAEVQVSQIGLIALRKGEENHSFYTTSELDARASTGRDTPAPSANTDISSLGETELSEWILTGKDGGAWTADEVLEKVGTDKDLATRMLSAEHQATDGEPRKGLTAGLTSIIEGS